ncbi:hypothetical protein COBT_002309, partial [Conglomerata obtusa]
MIKCCFLTDNHLENPKKDNDPSLKINQTELNTTNGCYRNNTQAKNAQIINLVTLIKSDSRLLKETQKIHFKNLSQKKVTIKNPIYKNTISYQVFEFFGHVINNLQNIKNILKEANKIIVGTQIEGLEQAYEKIKALQDKQEKYFSSINALIEGMNTTQNKQNTEDALINTTKGNFQNPHDIENKGYAELENLKNFANSIQKNHFNNAIFFINIAQKIKTKRKEIAIQEYVQEREDLPMQDEDKFEIDLVILEKMESPNKHILMKSFNSNLCKKICSPDYTVSLIYANKAIGKRARTNGIILVSKNKQQISIKRSYNATIEKTNIDSKDEDRIYKKFKPFTFDDILNMNKIDYPKGVNPNKLVPINEGVTPAISESQITNSSYDTTLDQQIDSANIVTFSLYDSLDNDRPYENNARSTQDLLNILRTGVLQYNSKSIYLSCKKPVEIIMNDVIYDSRKIKYNEEIQEYMSYDQFFMKYHEILKLIKNNIIENLGTNENTWTKLFIDNVQMHIDTLLESYSAIDHIHIKKYTDSILSYQILKIPVLNYRKCLLRNIDDKNSLCKENELFYGKLEQFVLSNFFLENFKFNNLYVFVKGSVQTIGLNNFLEDTYKNIKEDVVNVLKQAS